MEKDLVPRPVLKLYSLAFRSAERDPYSWETKLLLTELRFMDQGFFDSCCEDIATTIIGG